MDFDDGFVKRLKRRGQDVGSIRVIPLNDVTELFREFPQVAANKMPCVN